MRQESIEQGNVIVIRGVISGSFLLLLLLNTREKANDSGHGRDLYDWLTPGLFCASDLALLDEWNNRKI